ncbi:peptidase S8 and S53 subtilisin kexin sedolisin [Thermococcus sp. 4557]|uniref:S8 family serine peptidase n=1 Tax=Thermococcus sp. (strain CGMCC 1.5172 / 4557) TaxID=1042877 RepID=UPI000219E91D|nr:S8 family serine peptidase [Thermococcus sp. 4557]AEK73244.1 peptidase S8 and S53 subtilisin kexin sedolisin [Thermococcus sp. 4557]
MEVLIYLDPGYFKGRKFKEALRDIAEQLGIAGIRVLDSSANPIVAVIPSESALKAAENMPEISYIREAGRPFAVPVAGSVTSQGIFNVSAVYAWRKGYNGSGVKVGVLDIPDGGFSNYQTLVSQGELPSSTQLYTPNGAGSSVHGSACAEIVYDVAPGIDGLYLATYGDTKQMYDAVKWFIDNGVRVVSHSISNFGWGPSQFDTDNDETPEFWDVYLIINYTIQNDVLWVNAAGNNRLEHWEGDWTDNDGDGILDIYGTAVDGNSVEEDREGIQVTLNSDTSTTFRAWIRWSDYPYPNGGPTNDFDAYFECQNGNQWELIAKSEDYQNGQFGQEPLESISVDLNSAGLADGNNHYCRLYIKKYNAPDSDQMHFDVWWDGVAGYWYSYGGDSTYNPVVKEGSVTPPADHPNVLAVGAVNWTDTSKLEWFSSEGPAYNSYLRSGQWLKPNVVAPDWVSTASYGAFSGTSAAAPHAAGVAALVLSAKSSLSQRDVWAILQLTAKDVNETGIDYNTGYGLVNASDATPQYLSWKYPTPENGARIDEASVVINITSLFKSLKESNLTVNNNDYTMNPMDSTNKSWSFQLNNLPNGEYVYNATTRDSFRVWIVRTGSRKFYVDLGEKTAQEGIDGDPASGGWASDQIVSPGTSTVINGVFVWKDSDDGGFTSSCTGKTYDIKGLQLRADGDYIYVMVNLSEIPNYGKPPTPLVGVGFDVNNDGNLDYYAYAFLDKVGVSAGSAEFLDIYDTDWNNVAANDPDSVFVAGGNVIEMQIPRASIGNPNGQIGISAQVYEGLGAGRICSGSDYMTDNGNTVTTVDLASVPFFSSVMMLALIVLGLSMYFRKL